MTTRTKLNLASLTASTMMLLNVFSHLLRFSEGVQWGLILGVFVPLGMVFHYIKKLKEERAHEIAIGITPLAKIADEQSKIRRRLVVIWITMVPFTMSMPFWLPRVTGVSLGRRGDFIISLMTLGMVSLIFWIRVRKRPNKSAQTRSLARPV